MHWSEISSDPNDRRVADFLKRELKGRYRGLIADPDAFLADFVRARTVLDVGVVQHELFQTEKPGWKHGQIKKLADRLVGVDILRPQAEELVRRGFDVRVVDATSDTDLGDRFDRVVTGEVIEHVDNPVALLRFVARHLAEGGLALVSTPNPFFIDHLRQGYRDGLFIPNAEHVSWVTPTMALELGHRAGLQLHEYWHVQGEGITRSRRLVLAALASLGLQNAELFTRSFVYIYSK